MKAKRRATLTGSPSHPVMRPLIRTADGKGQTVADIEIEWSAEFDNEHGQAFEALRETKKAIHWAMWRTLPK